MTPEGGKGNGGTAFPAVGVVGIPRTRARAAHPRPLRAPPEREGGAVRGSVVAFADLDRDLPRRNARREARLRGRGHRPLMPGSRSVSLGFQIGRAHV